jgi:hypothetical protein
MQVQRSRDIEPTDTDDRDDDHGKMPSAIDIVSGRCFGWSGDWGPGRQGMLEERAGMKSTARPSRSLFRTIGVYGRLALKTFTSSSRRRRSSHPFFSKEASSPLIFTRQSNPPRMKHD